MNRRYGDDIEAQAKVPSRSRRRQQQRRAPEPPRDRNDDDARGDMSLKAAKGMISQAPGTYQEEMEARRKASTPRKNPQVSESSSSSNNAPYVILSPFQANIPIQWGLIIIFAIPLVL